MSPDSVIDSPSEPKLRRPLRDISNKFAIIVMSVSISSVYHSVTMARLKAPIGFLKKL